LTVCPVSRHSTEIDMLPISLVQIASRIRDSGGDCTPASMSAARSRSIRSLARSSHSPTNSMFRSVELLATIPGAAISFAEKITPPMIRSFGIAARNRPPGSRNARSGAGG
jgi:hypothetical protein